VSRRRVLTTAAAGLTALALACVAGASWTSPLDVSSMNVHAEVWPFTRTMSVDGANRVWGAWTEAGTGSSTLIKVALRTNGVWAAPQPLTPDNEVNAFPSIAVDGKGDAVAAWVHQVGANFEIEAATKSAKSAAWSQPVPVSDVGIVPVFGIGDVAMDSKGNAYVVWFRQGTTYVVEAAVHTKRGWSQTPEAISPAADNSYFPHVAVGKSGPMVVYSDQGMTTQVVKVATRSKKGVWTNTILSDPNAATVGGVTIATDPKGGTLVAWEDAANNGHVRAVMKQKKGWSATADLGPFSGTGAVPPYAAIDAAGDSVVTWQGNDGNNIRVAAATRTAGVWASWTYVSAAGFDATASGAAMTTTGTADVVWQRKTGATTDAARTAARPLGGSWSADTLLSGVGVNAQYPNAVATRDGQVVVLWTEVSGSTPVAVQSVSGP
jgi:hypothetical protein